MTGWTRCSAGSGATTSRATPGDLLALLAPVLAARRRGRRLLRADPQIHDRRHPDRRSDRRRSGRRSR